LIKERFDRIQLEQKIFRTAVKKGFKFLLLRNGGNNTVWQHSYDQLIHVFGKEGIIFQGPCGARTPTDPCKCCIHFQINRVQQQYYREQARLQPDLVGDPEYPEFGFEHRLFYPTSTGEIGEFTSRVFEETLYNTGIPRVSIIHTLDPNGRLREHPLMLIQTKESEEESLAYLTGKPVGHEPKILDFFGSGCHYLTKEYTTNFPKRTTVRDYKFQPGDLQETIFIPYEDWVRHITH
jgi:hypothetical protein